MTEQSSGFRADGDGEPRVFVCVCVSVFRVTIRGPDYWLPAWAWHVINMLFRRCHCCSHQCVSPLVLSSHMPHTPFPIWHSLTLISFLSFPISAEVKRKAAMRKFSFGDDWLLLSRLSDDISTLEVQHFLQRESAFEISTYLKLEMTLTYSSHFSSLHPGRGVWKQKQ